MSWGSEVRNDPGVLADPQAARNAVPETMLSGNPLRRKQFLS